MWYFDRHRNRACRTGNREQPIAELRQTRTAVWKFAFADDVALSIEQTPMMPLRPPIDAGKPSQSFSRQLRFPRLDTHAGLSRRLPVPVLALEGATSYWASVAANPPGHMASRVFRARV